MVGFKRSDINPANQREATYGQAVMMLSAQPVTRGNIDKSVKLFQAVIQANPSDDMGISAQYFLGRVEQAHRFELNPQGAIAIYKELYRKYPEHPLVQRAFVKLVLLSLYDRITDTERASRFTAFEAAGSGLRDHDAIRDFHLLMAAACEKFGLGQEKRLGHLLAVDSVGVSKADTKAVLLVSIGEVARKLRHKDLALTYYRRFLKECHRDYRVYTVEQRIAELEMEPQ